MQIKIEGIKREELYTGSMLIEIVESLQREAGEPFLDFFDRCERYHKLFRLAAIAESRGYHKAARLLTWIATRYYS